MAKQGTATATPRLRFPKFKDAPRWECTTLSHACEMQAGKFIAASEIFETPDEAAYPCYGGNGLRGYTATFTHSGRYPLIGRQGALCGNIQFARGDFYATEHALVSSPKPGIHVDWLFYALNGLELNRFATGQAQPGLSVDVLKSVPCAIPRDEGEQQKIADCLTSLYEVIAAQRRKVEALKAHKRGLMQQLFPREGETRPRLRFPEFRDAPEWEEARLQSLAKYENGKAYEQDIVDEGRFVVVNSRFVSTDGAVRKYTNADYCTAAQGDVLMVLSDLPNGRALAKCFLVDTDGRYAVNQRVARLTPTNVDPAFLYYRLNRTPRLLVFDDGLTQTHLSKGDVQDCLLCVPRERKEQQHIADCLSSLDTRIAVETNQLTALRTHKQGLMQQLFPAPDAATA